MTYFFSFIYRTDRRVYRYIIFIGRAYIYNIHIIYIGKYSRYSYLPIDKLLCIIYIRIYDVHVNFK